MAPITRLSTLRPLAGAALAPRLGAQIYRRGNATRPEEGNRLGSSRADKPNPAAPRSSLLLPGVALVVVAGALWLLPRGGTSKAKGMPQPPVKQVLETEKGSTGTQFHEPEKAESKRVQVPIQAGGQQERKQMTSSDIKTPEVNMNKAREKSWALSTFCTYQVGIMERTHDGLYYTGIC